MRSKRVDDRGLPGEAVALTVVHVVLDRAAGGAHRVDQQLRLRGRHDLVVGALEDEHGHADVARRG